jgi:hypothetical protein
LERKGMGQPGGHGGTYSRERQRVAALGAPTWRREKNGGSGRGRCVVSCAGSSPRAAVPSHTWERQGKGERELAGGQARGVGPTYQ